MIAGSPNAFKSRQDQPSGHVVGASSQLAIVWVQNLLCIGGAAQ